VPALCGVCFCFVLFGWLGFRVVCLFLLFLVCFVLFSVVLCCVALFGFVGAIVVLCCVVLCCVVLCCVVLGWFWYRVVLFCC